MLEQQKKEPNIRQVLENRSSGNNEITAIANKIKSIAQEMNSRSLFDGRHIYVREENNNINADMTNGLKAIYDGIKASNRRKIGALFATLERLIRGN